MLAFGSLGLLVTACAPGARGQRPPPVGSDDTTLGVGDVFDVRVYGEQELSGQYRVAQDGTIDFPLIGRVEVLGRQPYEVADAIEVRLREGGYLVNPQVSIFVQQYNSKRISVLGAVESPGSFEMRSGLTVIQAIGLAGGFTALANRDGTTVTRRVEGRLRRFSVPVDAIMRGEEEDFLLQPQDIVYVPERIF
jgi:polysaccharide export outer membrane protein